jgi:hypothetical protein
MLQRAPACIRELPPFWDDTHAQRDLTTEVHRYAGSFDKLTLRWISADRIRQSVITHESRDYLDGLFQYLPPRLVRLLQQTLPILQQDIEERETEMPTPIPSPVCGKVLPALSSHARRVKPPELLYTWSSPTFARGLVVGNNLCFKDDRGGSWPYGPRGCGSTISQSRVLGEVQR